MIKFLSVAVLVSLYVHASGQDTPASTVIKNYSVPQKRLLTVTTARFINIINQRIVERDSLLLLACKITGQPFLTVYSAGSIDDPGVVAAGLINAGNTKEASLMLKDLQADKRYPLLVSLGSWWLHRPGNKKKDLEQAHLYIQEAVALSNKYGNRDMQLRSLILQAGYLLQAGNEAECRKLLLQAIRSAQEKGAKLWEADAWLQLAQVNEKDDSTNLTYLASALAIYRAMGMKEKEIEVLWGFADYYVRTDLVQFKKIILEIVGMEQATGFRHNLYSHYMYSIVGLKQANYLDALEEIRAGIANLEWAGISALAGAFYTRLGATYLALGKQEDAMELFKKGFEKRTRETHLFWYKSVFYLTTQLADLGRPAEAIGVLHEVTNDIPPVTAWEKAQVLTTYGFCYQKLNKYKEADRNYQEYFALLKEDPYLDAAGEMSDTHIEIGRFYLSHREVDKARMFLDMIFPEKNSAVGTVADKEYMLFKIDSMAGDYRSAMNRYMLYKRFDDSSRAMEQREKFDELTIRYGAEKKDRDIKILEQDKKIQAGLLSQEKTTRYWILGGLALLLVIVGLLVYNVNLKQRTNRKLNRQRKEIEGQNLTLHQLVKEKEWLLKEIHHRVKNNLQVVMSLLNSQSVFIDNDVALTAIKDSQHRVHAMSLIHQKLFNSDNMSSIDMSVYIRELVSYLSDSFSTGQRIRFELDIDALEMDVSQAVPVGLILNEAITNSIKYAFPDGRDGVISVSLRKTVEDRLLLGVSDNGVGMPKDYDGEKQGSLGMRLMQGLSEDLEGHFSISGDNGTRIMISFEHDLSVKRGEHTERPVLSEN